MSPSFSDQCPRLGKSGQDLAVSPIRPGGQLPTCLDLSPAMFARRFVCRKQDLRDSLFDVGFGNLGKCPLDTPNASPFA
ncbi:hypothetical protein ElyMa_005876900 [Elysia marginata]|uniref:Uncharacterized protein n=1 Tax=Elysia marginata TaxID=1093978 RepID=A0AAV4G3A1_9GAST|nr:hypothetical protein ElyMa_005876900 [Elysia marginata]